MVIAAVASALMFFLVDFMPFVETVGFLAVFTEAMLGVPQFYRCLAGNLDRNPSYDDFQQSQEFQEPIHIRDVAADGGDVDLRRCLQDLVLLPEGHPGPVLHLRRAPGK